VTGGVFYAEALSLIKCSNCEFDDNFALKGGVIYTNEDG